MKNMKKLASILLALVMVLAMATTAFAATITVKGNEGATYDAYKIFDVTTNAAGNGYTYTIASNSEWYDVVNSYATANPTLITLTADKIVDGVTTYIVTATAEFDEVKAAEFAKYLNDRIPEGATALTATIGAGETSAVIENADAGYYFVTTTVGALCALETATAIAEIEEKNDVPTSDKKITGEIKLDQNGKQATADIGTVVNFEATIDVEKGAIGYVFNDTMTSGLTFNSTSVVVKVGEENISASTTETKTWEMQNVDDHHFEIKFDNDWIAGKVGETITITYTATLNQNALTTDKEKNTAYLKYGNDPGTHKTPDKTTEVYDFDIVIDKFAKNTDNQDDQTAKLEGAKFVLGDDSTQTKYYSVDANGVVTWVDDIADATEVTTDANGKASFKGLAAGDYKLIETVAPAGYNKLTAPVDVKITATSATETTISTTANSTNNGQYEQEVDVANQSGSELPSTGGIGTTIFYVSGAVLAIAAVVFLVTKKRMSGEEE